MTAVNALFVGLIVGLVLGGFGFLMIMMSERYEHWIGKPKIKPRWAYVAGKFESKEEVQEIQDQLKRLGILITHDWTRTDENTTGLMKSAQDDIEGVRKADFVVVLNHSKLFGGAVELGFALGLNKRVYVINPQVRHNIFWELPSSYGLKTFPTADAAFQAIERDIK